MNHEDISAIVLAAGLSRRAFPRHKLLIEYEGKAIIRSVVEAVSSIGFGQTIVVVGHERERIEDTLEGLAVKFVFAPDYAKGMGHSLAAGIRTAKASASGLLITVGDLPYLKAEHIKTVADHFIAHKGEHHCIPTFQDQPGHPVILGPWLRPELESLHGDAGARHLLQSQSERKRIEYVEAKSVAAVYDVDHECS